MIILSLPLILIAEHIWTKRQDWILTPKEFAENTFWLATLGLIWVAFYSNYYKTPISEGLKTLRNVSPLNFELKPGSILGLILVTIVLRTLIEFIYYWLNRMQHKFLFWWRIHAAHQSFLH